MMDYNEIKLLLTVVNMLASAGVGLFVWQNKRQQATVGSISTLEAHINSAIADHKQAVDLRLESMRLRTCELERQVHLAPTKEDIIRIHQRLETMDKGINRDLREIILMLGDNVGQMKQLNKERNNG